MMITTDVVLYRLNSYKKEAICTNFQATLASGSGAFEYKPSEEE